MDSYRTTTELANGPITAKPIPSWMTALWTLYRTIPLKISLCFLYTGMSPKIPCIWGRGS